jgi:acetyl-CoA C-acetyltransferase
MVEAYIFDAVRTPRGRGKSSGTLHEVKPISLVKTLMHSLQKRNDLDTALIDDVVMGIVSPVGEQGSVLPKTAALAAGWNTQVAGVQVNRFCASGLEAINLAAMKVRSGWEDLVCAGGVESMSRVPLGADGGAWAADPQTNISTGFVPQGIGADLIATLDGFSRDDVDHYGMRSHQKAAAAKAANKFAKSLVPVCDELGLPILDHDETVRGETTMEALRQLKPSFEKMGAMGYDQVALRKYPQVERIHHVHHAGNSSGIVDGAALTLIGSEAMGKRIGLKPRARIVSAAITSTEPTIMLTGPAPAARKALAKAGLTVNDIDLFEVNEAFASVVMRFMSEMNVDPDKVNVNGGSIALGHPLGATGAVIIATLIDELEARGLRRGMATLCVGGGMGIATIVERC